MTSTQNRGGGVLKFVTRLQVLLFLDLFFTFADGVGGGGGGGGGWIVCYKISYFLWKS